MPNNTHTELIKTVAVTAELIGSELSEAAKKQMVSDLSAYPHDQVIGALSRCRKELRGKLTIAEVINRLDDGRPGPEQAWAMIPKSEDQTVCWTQEIADAFFIALPLIEAGDMVQARMAFLEVYKDKLVKAREQHIPVEWSISLGHDPKGREDVIREALETKKISADKAKHLLPHLEEQKDRKRLPHEPIPAHEYVTGE